MSYLIEDARVPCFDAQHMEMILFIAAPSIAVYVIGIPLGIFVILKRNARHLHSDRFRFRYGMLISGYTDSYYWWEAVVAWRKAIIIMTSVVGGLLGASAQIYAAIGLLIIFLCLQISTKPYTSSLLNHMENCGLVVSFFTLYLGICFYFAEPDDTWRVTLTMCVATLNLIYLLYVLWEIIINQALRHRGLSRRIVMCILPLRRRFCPQKRKKKRFDTVARALQALAHTQRTMVKPASSIETSGSQDLTLRAAATWGEERMHRGN